MGTTELELRGEELLNRFTGEKRLDMDSRIKVCDVEGLSTLASISRHDALRLISKTREEDAGTAERRVLRTGDARKLRRELLEYLRR